MTTPTTNTLETELAAYAKAKDSLLASDRGKFVLIKGDKIVGIFENEIDAARRGFDEFGNTPFLVKQIEESEDITNFASFKLHESIHP